ncbi:MAG: CCA tRNA nucleotidyltransferase [Acutalibacteraceae bacterium]
MNVFSESARTALRLLSKSGYPSYLVGGCVRDSIMGLDANDTDITTPAEPEKVKEIFEGYKVIETGMKHGTVTVIIDGEAIEITTFRTESVYSDNRHPDKVAFSKSLSDDLSRRDFTVNALCLDEQGKIIDLFGGIKDIEKKTIRCIGNAEERFKEDSLRILRALRFSSKLGFEIDGETEKDMFGCRSLLKNLSAERIYSELKKILCGSFAGKTIRKYYDILVEVLPEIRGMKDFDQHNFHHIYDVLEHTARVVDAVRPEPYMRFAALFHDCAKPDCFSLDGEGVGHFYSHAPKGAKKAQQALLRLKADNFTSERTVKLVKIHDSPIEADERTIRRKLQKLGEPLLYDLIELQRADNLAQAPQFRSRQKHFDELVAITKSVIEKSQCFSLKQLAVDGNDLIKLGYEGRRIGRALNILLNAVIDEKTENKKTSLLMFLESRYPPTQN